MSFRRNVAKALAVTTLVTGVLAGGQIAFAGEKYVGSEDPVYNISLADEFAPGKVIVVFKEGYEVASAGSIDALGLSSIGVEASKDLTKAKKPAKAKKYDESISNEKKMKKMLLLTLKDKSKKGVLDAIKKLNKLPGVAYAEPDYILKANNTVPNDPSFSNLYGMSKIGAPQAWDKTTGSSEIVVGVIDTGIDYNHPDLKDNMWTNPGEIPGDGIDNDNNGYVDDVYGWDFVYGDNDPMDGHSHGTHCAGTIAGVGNNEVGVAGVSWNSKLAALKYLSDSGSGNVSDSVEAINYASAMGFKVINASYGGTYYSQTVKDAIAAFPGLFVAAAGNNYDLDNDITPHYPSSYDLDNIIAVANTDSNDNLASSSHYGLTSVDLSAPGTRIYSTIPGGYAYYSGTSMAAPHVAGSAALLLSANSSLKPEQLREIILSTVDSVPALQGMVATGGRLNVAKAMDKVMGLVLIGDIHKDGSINSTDYSVLKRFILGITPFTYEQMVAADLNGDGDVNSTDYTLLNRYILGITDTFPAGATYSFTFGDVDTDGKVSTSDSTLVHNYLVGGAELTNKQLLAADVDGNNIVDTVDKTLIEQYINQLIVNLPVGN